MTGLLRTGSRQGVLNASWAGGGGQDPAPLTRILILLVRAYRAALVPFFGPCCRFEPSCSRYAEEALRRHGVMTGLRLTLFRLGRCHPLCAGGLDPVPNEKGRG